MTLDQWLDRRELVPPPALRHRLHAAARAAGPTGEAVSDAAAHAALRLLEDLLHAKDPSRAAALELLTVDALMTYAFEASADVPERLDALAELAMRRIAAAAAEHPA